VNYTVIARRWRPKKFDDVIGQPHIITTIKNSVRLGRIAHAYLFAGPRGVGKTSLARILAKTANCTGRSTEEPCGQCENCLAIDSGNFVDIIEIDAASTRKIEDIRELRQNVRYLPMKGKYKIYILDEAHQLTGDAKDAFLKTLEEPPGHNIFILATTEAQKIPYTIMSRCQRFDFRRIPEADISSQLKKICQAEEITYEEGVFSYIALEADGGLRDAESLLDQIIAYCGKHLTEKDVINVIGIVERDVLHGIVKSVTLGDMRGGLEIIENTLQQGYDVHQIYRGLVGLLRNMMVIKVCEGIPSFLYMAEEEYKELLPLMESLEYYEIQNMLFYLLKAEDMLKGLFPKVSMEVLYVNLYNLFKLRDVEKILDNLGDRGSPETTQVSVGRESDLPPPSLPISPPVKKESSAVTSGEAESYAGKDARGFTEYMKKEKPLIGNMLDALRTQVENDNLIVMLDKTYGSFVKNEADEIRKHLREYFGRNMGVLFKDAGEIKKNLLEEYVREAETLFKT